MVKKNKRGKKSRNKRKKSSNSKLIDINTIWPSEDKKNVAVPEKAPPPPPPQQQQEFPHDMPQEEIDKIKEQQGLLHLKLKRLMLKYDISDKNMDKAGKLWLYARVLPQCEKIPNPAEWVLNHEHLTKYWTDLTMSAKQCDGVIIDKAKIPPHLALVLDKTSSISIYMNYLHKYFID